MTPFNNPQVAEIFKTYPANMRSKLMTLRQMVYDTATEIKDINNLEETLKWGVPSYITHIGSTIRIDWNASNPHEYGLCLAFVLPIFGLWNGVL